MTSLPLPADTLAAIGEPNEPDLPGPPVAGDETATLLGSLERQRSTFAWKCGGLDEAGLAATVGASSITLGGLVKHLAFLEDYEFSTMLLGRDLVSPWSEVDWEADEDWPWTSAAGDSPAVLYSLWQDGVTRARSSIAEALTNGGLDQRVAYDESDDPISVRRLLVDMIEEYARHVGHADLIRESVDGLVGEDPPEVSPPYQVATVGS